MKNIIFLVFISISSHALVTCDYNSAVDKLNTSSLSTGQCKELSTPVDVLYDSSCGDNLLAKYYGPLYTNYCTDATVVQHTKYNLQIYSVQRNYTGCPVGQEIINGVCATPPTCASGTTWNSLTDTCQTNDSDGDGIPDKCDLDSADIATLDCDGDGLANNGDGDMDGDGVPNSSDANPLDSANTASCPAISSGYQLSISVTDASSCSLSNSLFTANDGDLFYTKYANWDSCRNKCYFVQTSCPKGQAIKNGECRSVEPNIGDCAGTSTCRIIGLGVGDLQSCFKTCNCLTTSSPTPTTENNYFYEEVSCADNQTDKEKLDDLRDSSEVNTTVNKLDINGSVNNDTAASFKAALDSYAGAKESTSLSQLKELAIQSLEAVKTNSILDNLKSLAENFFNTSTSNDGVIDGTLNGIKDNTAISNNLLTGIKDGVDGIKENSDKVLNNLEGKNSDGTAVDTSSLDSAFNSADSFISSTQNAFTNIQTSYADLYQNINTGFEYSIQGGSSISLSANVFGRTINFDMSSWLQQLSPLFYYMTYISIFLIAIKLIFLGFMVV